MDDLSTYEGRRALWADALQNGKYTQWLGALRTIQPEDSGPIRACCLGVACEIVIEHHGDLTRNVNDALYVYATMGGVRDTSTGFLPTAAQAWLGLTDPRPEVSMDQELFDVCKMVGYWWESITYGEAPQTVALHALNDGGIGWGQIARLIREEKIVGVKTGHVEVETAE